MNYDNYMELYEAVYIFDQLNHKKEIIQASNSSAIEALSIHPHAYQALLRILVVNDLLSFKDKVYYLSETNHIKQEEILEIINKDPNKQFEGLLKKAKQKAYFFFEQISDEAYDIYSRYNFNMTYQMGVEVSKHIDMTNKKVLEIGGNSGGFATAIVKESSHCDYTIVDMKIPCKIGNIFKREHQTSITFIENNMFDLKLADTSYDYIVLMNILHDFDREKCKQIIENCIKYTHLKTQFIIIEDILIKEFEPKAAIMHGLRLAIECRGGKQRTIGEFENLFKEYNYQIKTALRISPVHTILRLEECK